MKFLKNILTVIMISLCLSSAACQKTNSSAEQQKDVFLGVYISKAEYTDNDFKETQPFSDSVLYEKSDTFSVTEINENEIFYCAEYTVTKETMEFFIPYLVLKQPDGIIKTKPFRNSVYACTGVKYTLTENYPVFTGQTAKPEYLRVTFNYR